MKMATVFRASVAGLVLSLGAVSAQAGKRSTGASTPSPILLPDLPSPADVSRLPVAMIPTGVRPSVSTAPSPAVGDGLPVGAIPRLSTMPDPPPLAVAPQAATALTPLSVEVDRIVPMTPTETKPPISIFEVVKPAIASVNVPSAVVPGLAPQPAVPQPAIATAGIQAQFILFAAAIPEPVRISIPQAMPSLGSRGMASGAVNRQFAVPANPQANSGARVSAPRDRDESQALSSFGRWPVNNASRPGQAVPDHAIPADVQLALAGKPAMAQEQGSPVKSPRAASRSAVPNRTIVSDEQAPLRPRISYQW